MPKEISSDKKAFDLSEEMPLIEGLEKEEELLLGRDLTVSLIKAIKADRVYPSDNPILDVFREQLVKKFQFFLNKYPSFIFQIGEFTLSFMEKVLYENKDLKSSLAFFFFKDGVRELRFMKGIEEWEILEFLKIVKKTSSLTEMDDDFVTLIWDKDFNHISYLATDEFLEDNPITIPDNIGRFKDKLVGGPIPLHNELDFLDEEAKRDSDLEDTPSMMIEERVPLLLNRNVYMLTNEEAERLQKEVESESDPFFVFSITDILFEILSLEKRHEPFQEAVNLLGKVMDALLALGEFQKASDLLRRVYIVLKTYELKDWQAKIIQKLIHESGEEPRIELIKKVVEKEMEFNSEDLSSYLMLLRQNAIKPLVHLLGELNSSKARRVVCDTLSEIGKNAFELFIPYIDDRKWYLVRNIVYILGQIRNEQSIPSIQKAFHHEDPRVRREVVRALGLIGGPKVVPLLSKALMDEDVRVRAMAALNLGKVGDRVALDSLLEIIQSKDFLKKESSEIKVFFEVIGMMGFTEAIPALKHLLLYRSRFSRGIAGEIRKEAANALAMIGTLEAKEILIKGKSSHEESIRNACLQTLKKIPSKESLG